MATINFPSSPVDGDVFTAGDHTWVFSAVSAGGPGAWNLQAQTVTGPTGPTGAGSTGPTGPTGSGGTGPTGPTGIGWTVYQTTGYVFYSGATGYNMAAGQGAMNATAPTGSGSGLNIAIGADSMQDITTGGYNYSLGVQTLRDVTTGARNVAIGFRALGGSDFFGSGLTTGDRNMAIGHYSLGLTTGSRNTAIGENAGYYHTSGSDNTMIGSYAAISLATGQVNIAIGARSMFNGAYPGFGTITGDQNIAIGYYTLGKLTTGAYNVAIGSNALYSNITGTNNVAIGVDAADKVTTGTTNTVIGSSAGSSGTNDLTTGANNTIIGYDAAATSASVSNQATVGNASVTNFRVPGVGFDIDTNRASVTGYAKVSEYYASTAPLQKNADFTLADTENYIVNTKTSNLVVTLPSGADYTGRAVTFINHVNHKVVSASSNVYDHSTGVLGTDITSAVAGKNSTIVHDGTNWYIMSTNL